MPIINDLVTKFSFIGSTTPLDNFNTGTSGAITLLGGMTLALNAAAAGFGYWAGQVLGGVDALDQLSKQTRVSVADIQELIYAAGQLQSSPEAVAASLQGLTKTIGDAAQKGSEDFARLGISVRNSSGQIRDAGQVLEDVRRRFVALGLSVQEQEHFAGALGIDSSLLQLLNKTDAEMGSLRDRARELGTLTDEQVDKAATYKRSLNDLWFGFNAVKQMVAIGVAPELSRLADQFSQLLVENKAWIIQGISATVTWIGNLLSAFNRLLPVFGVLAAALAILRVATLGFGKVLALVLSPAVLITAAVVALLLIIDDLIVAFQGGQSVIADFFQEFLGVDVVQVLKDIGSAAQEMGATVWAAVKDLGGIFYEAFSGVGDLLRGNFDEGIDHILRSFQNLGDLILRIMAPVFDWVRSTAANLLPEWAVDLLGLQPGTQAPPESSTLPPPVAPQLPGAAVPADIPAIPERLRDRQQPADVPGIPQRIPQGAAMPASNTVIDNRQVNQTNEIRVASPDPLSAARAVDDRLQRQLDNASTQLNVGGR